MAIPDGFQLFKLRRRRESGIRTRESVIVVDTPFLPLHKPVEMGARGCQLLHRSATKLPTGVPLAPDGGAKTSLLGEAETLGGGERTFGILSLTTTTAVEAKQYSQVERVNSHGDASAGRWTSLVIDILIGPALLDEVAH